MEVTAVLSSRIEISFSNRVTAPNSYYAPHREEYMEIVGNFWCRRAICYVLLSQDTSALRANVSTDKPLKYNPRPISFVGEVGDSKWTLALTLVPNCAANLEQALVSDSLFTLSIATQITKVESAASGIILLSGAS
jgi:hypothetical protein